MISNRARGSNVRVGLVSSKVAADRAETSEGSSGQVVTRKVTVTTISLRTVTADSGHHSYHASKKRSIKRKFRIKFAKHRPSLQVQVEEARA
jgi:hypothetical protein